MSSDVTVKPESIDVGLSGSDGPADAASTEVFAETEPDTGELVDTVTEATWNEALRQLGGLPSNPLPLWTMLASRILRAVADGERDAEPEAFRLSRAQRSRWVRRRAPFLNLRSFDGDLSIEDAR